MAWKGRVVTGMFHKRALRLKFSPTLDMKPQQNPNLQGLLQINLPYSLKYKAHFLKSSISSKKGLHFKVKRKSKITEDVSLVMHLTWHFVFFLEPSIGKTGCILNVKEYGIFSVLLAKNTLWFGRGGSLFLAVDFCCRNGPPWTSYCICVLLILQEDSEVCNSTFQKVCKRYLSPARASSTSCLWLSSLLTHPPRKMTWNVSIGLRATLGGTTSTFSERQHHGLALKRQLRCTDWTCIQYVCFPPFTPIAYTLDTALIKTAVSNTKHINLSYVPLR